MIQCKDCELCDISPDNRKTFKCDPFINVKEPECILKWQLIRLDMLAASHQATLRWYEKLAPMQGKLFKYMKKEIDQMDESENWRVDEDEDDETESF